MGEKKIKRVKPGLWSAVMNAASKVFPPKNKYGVFSFGIGPKITRGISLGYKTLVVFVERKMKTTNSPIPSVRISDSEGDLLVIPDVIATGSRPRLGRSPGNYYNGLHPGSVIKVYDGRGGNYGGVACILTTNTEPEYLLTVGHLFSRDAIGTKVFAGYPEPADREIECGKLIVNLLDLHRSVYNSDIDAALIELNDEGIELVKESNSKDDVPILEKLYKLKYGKIGKVKVFRPTSNEYSDDSDIICYINTVYIEDNHARGDYIIVNNGLVTRHLLTKEGDSGCPCFTSKRPRGVVGLCVGEYYRCSFFEPIARVLEILNAHIPNIQLYRS